MTSKQVQILIYFYKPALNPHSKNRYAHEQNSTSVWWNSFEPKASLVMMNLDISI